MAITSENLRGSDFIFNVFQTNIMTYFGSKGFPFTMLTEELTAGKALQTNMDNGFGESE